MELLKVEEVAAVTLFEIKLSESELEAFEACIDYVLGKCDERELIQLTGCESNELYACREALRELLRAHVLNEFVPERYRGNSGG